MTPTSSVHAPFRTFTGVSALAIALALILGLAAEPAAATSDYPSWQDVQDARGSESAKQEQIAQLQALIGSLTAEARTAEELATLRGSEYEAAQARFDEATYTAGILQAAADDATARAEESGRTAGQIAATMARAGQSDPSMGMLLDRDAGDDLLTRLTLMNTLTERISLINRAADVERNSANAITEQARLAQSILGDLAEQAETALTAAIAAREEANRKLVEQQTNEATMRSQLAVLTEDREATEADFEKGEAARRAAEAARAAGIGGRDSGQLSDQGWALPISGWISSSYGPRPNRPVAGVGAFHYGTDIAAGCGRPVFSATAGTVLYADRLGTYGLWVLIDHGNGVQTGYAHNSKLLVSPGQRVPAGANVAEVGTTGASSGCHLHFEVRVGGARLDPEPFMTDRGVTFG